MIFGDNCIGCGECVAYCPVDALVEDNEGVKYLYERCVECQLCVRADICPVDNLKSEMSPWPRSIRHYFSDPFAIHPSTSLGGRGTEEVKTNDVTRLLETGFVGVAVEAGRPGLGCSFADVEIVTKALSKYRVQYPGNTPITALIENPLTGELKEDILKERILSVIIECIVPAGEAVKVINDLYEVTGGVEGTVFSVGVFFDAETKKMLPDLEMWGIPLEGILPNGKVNLGLGRKPEERC